MKTLRLKLISMLAMLFLMFGVLTVGIFAVNQQTVTLTGNISFRVEDRSLYVKQVRIKQDNNSEPQPVTAFMPGYINGEFNMNIGDYSGENANKIGSFALYFDIINTTDIQWAISSVTLAPEIEDSVSVSYSGVVYETTLTEVDENGDKVIDPVNTAINGTLILIVTAPSLPSIDLSDITITINEYVDPAVQVTNVQINDSTPDSTSEYNGIKGFNKPLDLSNISFETGTTEVIISMTSLKPTYIKNNVSWYNTSGVTITSTSLYLPKNTTGDITGGKSKNLKITVTNNSGSPITVSGLEVAFEEKEDLLQATAEGEVSQYTREGYWYVEMGTYSTTSNNEEGKRESEYLRWRYFSDTSTHYEFDRNTRPTGEGYFILETWIQQFYPNGNATDLGVSWNNDYKGLYSSGKHQLNGWTNIDANDYSTSTIRQYINGNTVQKSAYKQSGTYVPSGASTNMFEYFNIDPDNDIIYTDIIGRTLGDLYTDMTDATTDPQDVTMPKGSSSGWEGAEITYSEDDTDKFWLLSYYEAYTLLSGNATTSSDTDRKWGGQYWLRSPNPSYSSNNAYHVSTSGFLSDYYVYLYINVARAAFKFSVDNIA